MDAYRYFEELHEQGNLLPTKYDYLRDRAEAAIRVQRGLDGAMNLEQRGGLLR